MPNLLIGVSGRTAAKATGSKRPHPAAAVSRARRSRQPADRRFAAWDA